MKKQAPDSAELHDKRLEADRKQYRHETGKRYKRIEKVKPSRPKIDPRDYSEVDDV